jgi:transcriptional regulator with PAS, ATPase and Fis domain
MEFFEESINSKSTVVQNASSSRRSFKILTQNKQFGYILDLASKVAALNTPVLITGESGSGKDLLARYIHTQGRSDNAPFIGVNCASVPKDLMESEFFGYEIGSFTGANTSRVGLFESAHNGTLFLDEIGDMPLSLQVKLLRAIQEGEIRRLGSSKSIPLNIRIISATNRDLEEDVEKNIFREDLYYRIGVFILQIPPLRDRKEDIPILAKHFCEIFSRAQKREVPCITNEALHSMARYSWPGNVRELENVIERALVFSDDEITSDDLQLTTSHVSSEMDFLQRPLAEIAQIAQQNAETSAIIQALTLTGGNKVKAASLLEVSYKTLLNKIRQYELQI